MKEIAKFFTHTHDGYELTGSIIGGIIIAALLFVIAAATKKPDLLLTRTHLF